MIGANLKDHGLIDDAKKAPKMTRAAASQGILRSLTIIERQHKKREIRHGGGAPRSGKWTTRTGQLIRSFRQYYTKGALEGYYGSEKVYSRMVEGGGTIKPKSAKALAIPLRGAKYGVGGGLGPRHYNDLFLLRSKAGKLLLVRRRGEDGIEPMFVLKRQVKLKPRRGLARTEIKTRKKVVNLIGDAVIQPWEG